MKKSLYKKFYVTFLVVVLAALLFLGSLILTFSGNYWINQNQTLLYSQAESVARQVEMASTRFGGEMLSQYAGQIAGLIGDATQCDIVLLNTDGQTVSATGQLASGADIDPQAFARYLQSGGTTIGNLDGLFTGECLIAVVPIEIDGEPAGVAVAAMSMGTAGAFVQNIFRMLLVAVLVMVVLLIIAAYIMASAMVRPLRQMSDAALRLAEGDFSGRIEVNRQDELGLLADAFNYMTDSLEAGEKMRRGFVANVSHELKTPMTTISGFVDGILDGTIPPEKQEEYLMVVSIEIKRLSRLVSAMLNLAKLEAGEKPLNPVSVDLTNTVIQVALAFEQPIMQKEIELQGLDSLPRLTCKADADLIHQVVYNLVDNAVKYTPAGGHIAIEGQIDPKGQAVLTVHNSGKGIAEEDLPFVFDRFYKVDKSRGTDKTSLGLGLYLVKTIVNLHGGSITVRSKENEFCEFELVMPGFEGE